MSKYKFRHFSEYFESNLTEKIQRVLDNGSIPVQLNVVKLRDCTDAYLITKEPETESATEQIIDN